MYRFANLVGQKEFFTFVFISIFLSLYSSAKSPLAEESMVCEDLKKSSRMSSKFRAALRKNLMLVNECSQDLGKGGCRIPFCAHIPMLWVDPAPPELWVRAGYLGSHGQQPDRYPLGKPGSAESTGTCQWAAWDRGVQVPGRAQEDEGHRAVGTK